MTENNEQILEINIYGVCLQNISEMFCRFYEGGWSNAFNRVFHGATAQYKKWKFEDKNRLSDGEEVTILFMKIQPRMHERIVVKDLNGKKYTVHPLSLTFKRFRQ